MSGSWNNSDRSLQGAMDAGRRMKISSTKPHEETLRSDFIFVILPVALWMIFRGTGDAFATVA
jgi:hypothetical protein